jgi:3',5'-cyclic-AMP phosphodiesterase
VATIVQLSDLHLWADPEGVLFGIPTRRTLRDVLAHIEASGLKPHYVVVTGDHTHDELPETYAAARELLAPYLDRLHQVPGNHDDRARLREGFSDRVGGEGAERITFSFEAEGWLCLGLDTHVPGEVGGRIGEEQLEWVRSRIGERQPRGAVLFMHHPPVELGIPWLDRIGVEDRAAFQALLADEPRIRLVSCGHVHHESSHRVEGAEIVTVPSTGLQFSPDSPVAAFVPAPPGYRVIELDGDVCATSVVRLPEKGVITPVQPPLEL